MTSLLREGVAIDSKDHEGNTALMRSAAQGHASVVSHLLAHGADVHATNKVPLRVFQRGLRGLREGIQRASGSSLCLLLVSACDVPLRWEGLTFDLTSL